MKRGCLMKSLRRKMHNAMKDRLSSKHLQLRPNFTFRRQVNITVQTAIPSPSRRLRNAYNWNRKELQNLSSLCLTSCYWNGKTTYRRQWPLLRFHNELWLIKNVGVGEGTFFGVRRILAGISPDLRKEIFGHFLCKHFLKQAFIWMTPKKGLYVIMQTLGAIFAQIFRDFAKVFTDFTQIYTNFARIFKDFPGFSTYWNFRGCAFTPCTLASYTTDAAIQLLLIAVSNVVLYCVKEERWKM